MANQMEAWALGISWLWDFGYKSSHASGRQYLLAGHHLQQPGVLLQEGMGHASTFPFVVPDGMVISRRLENSMVP